MAETAVYNSKKEEVGKVELNDAIFGVAVNPGILHDVVRMQRANRRSGNASTKTRTEVSGSSAKPWRQKGTGRARAGHKRSPLWRGGGVTFGPKPRSYSYNLPKKIKRLGLCMALSSRFAEEQMTVLTGFELDEIKTKKFLTVMAALDLSNALIVTPEHDEQLTRSARNVYGFKVLPIIGLNVYDILHHRHLVVLQPSISKLEERLLA